MSPLHDPLRIDPSDLSHALLDSGWRLMGQSRGVLRFEASHIGSRPWILLPNSQEVQGAANLMDEAMRQLDAFAPGIRERLEVSQGLRRVAGVRDSLRFRKETAAPRGLIAWPEGEGLVRAARETLAAGAKAFAGKKAYFGKSHSGFAQRYLSACYMGQTGIGSYVVTALTPVAQIDPGSEPNSQYAHVQGREITQTLSTALEATVESVEHYRSSRSVAGFRDAVGRGLSVELARGLIGLAERAEEATIHVEFDSASAPLFGGNEPVVFEFTGADLPALQIAATALAQEPEVPLKQTVRGRVHLLTKAEVDAPGVVGIDTGAGKFRLRLSPEDYARAVRAHEVEAVIVAEGIPSKEGNIAWLYNALLVDVDSISDTLF